ncbi:DEAD/DEAH box helicase [Clostridium estertheticum]|uniref:DEAD/DEAH box helicase n=1 Tax=Clostridium estertheticum TaxID=238834 RepID=UPI001C0E2F76|nr:DEAD/DEAH box helicase family protein [Clostridium estertheticum]MBU3169905.1 DEAD/DEAH box helicase family protein [Clostridium estertheticum]
MGSYFAEQYGNLKFVKETKTNSGLRNAQIGAIHAISSFFTLHNNKAAIVIMPTGSGKTAVLMMTPYVIESLKVLIVTPSIMVRGQITEDFENLKTLCKATVFNEDVQKPKIYEIKHMYSEEEMQNVINSDVIVATPHCALSISENEEVRNKFDLVLIDEAHHVAAKTWEQILINMSGAKHVLFTATPFRLDKKEIKGDMIYAYPLSMAYSDGIFGEIEYIPIEEAPNRDYLIAKKTEKVFYTDRELGFEHYLMVRTNTKDKAKELEVLYSQETELKLKRIDSSMTNYTVKNCVMDLKERKLDGIICVDMLGEGFDFPNLKIAAIHSPHKSLASTLQFIGRFARTNTENIGTAKFIAMNDSELLIENTAMYTNNAIWLDIIIDLSESRAKEEEDTKEYFRDFRKNADNIISGTEEYSLNSIRPNCHAKIYKVTEFDITAQFPNMCNVVDGTLINENDKTVVGIGKENTPPKWSSSDNIININNILYIVHYQRDCNLLFIYSQIKTEVVYESIAEAFCKTFKKIPKHQMNRVLGELKGFEIFNSGMKNRFSESGESYRISAGSDVSAAIDPVTGKLYSAGHVFCKAYTDEHEVTIGYSSGSKMWSSTYFPIPEYVRWCNFNGKKIMNAEITVKTNTNYDYLPIPTQLKKYPNNIFMCDYSAKTYSSPPVLFSRESDSCKCILIDIAPCIKEIKDNSITLEFYYRDSSVNIICNLEGKYISNNEQLILMDGRDKVPLTEYLDEYPLIFKSTDDVMIQGIEYCEGNPSAISFSSDNIVGVDWDYYGTDRKIEVNDARYHPIGTSIQTTLEQILREDVDSKYIIYDHSKGEMADYITIKVSEFNLEATLFHVKSMSAGNYNSSVGDMYEVAGQAVKSTIWLKTKAGFISKVTDRRRSGHGEFLVGSFEEFKKSMKQNKQLVGRVVIVQPSISKSVPIPDKIQEVLAAARYYINNSGKVKSLEIWGSL